MRTKKQLQDLIQQLENEKGAIAIEIGNKEDEIEDLADQYATLEDMLTDAEQELNDLGMEEVDL